MVLTREPTSTGSFSQPPARQLRMPSQPRPARIQAYRTPPTVRSPLTVRPAQAVRPGRQSGLAGERSEPGRRHDASQRQPGRHDSRYCLCQHQPRTRLRGIARRGLSAERQRRRLQPAGQPRLADLLQVTRELVRPASARRGRDPDRQEGQQAEQGSFGRGAELAAEPVSRRSRRRGRGQRPSARSTRRPRGPAAPDRADHSRCCQAWQAGPGGRA